MRKRIIIFIFTLTAISVSVDADAIFFTSAGVSHNNSLNNRYYIDHGIVLFFIPVGFHYEINQELSLFTGLLYPSCLGKTQSTYFCYLRAGFNEKYSYTRFGLTIQTSIPRIFVNISYKSKNKSYKKSENLLSGGSLLSEGNLLFGISYVH